MIMRSRFLNLSLFLCLSLAAAGVLAQDVTGISVLNTSSGMPNSSDFVERYFETASTLDPLRVEGSSASFTHRLAFLNSLVAGGGQPQVNARNAIIQLTFTVEDPDEVGYHIDLTSVMSGVSSVTQTEGDGTALATGLTMTASYGLDSTDPADFDNLPVFYGQSTSGVSVSGQGTATELREDTVVGPLGQGSFVGTRTYSLLFSSGQTPTTNVIIPNGDTGSGYVNYGLGVDVGDTGASPDDLGHFLTVTVTFEGGTVESTATSWGSVKALFD